MNTHPASKKAEFELLSQFLAVEIFYFRRNVNDGNLRSDHEAPGGSFEVSAVVGVSR